MNAEETPTSMPPALYDTKTPQVSIVILNLNKPEMTIDCLRHLWQHTTGARYEVVLVDNGSWPDRYAALATYDGPHTLVRLAINRFFGEGNNIGAERAKGEFLVFLNNDVMVTEGWLEPLLEVFETHADAGCAGPKFVYPNGELQEAGALIDEEGMALQIGKFQSPDQPRFNRQRRVDYVSAAAVMLRRSDFEAVLGFDFRYEPAYYEDCDLCLKVATLGKKTYFEPASEVVHHESTTTSDTSHGLRLSTIMDVNREKFVKRWQGFLKTGRHGERRFETHLVPANASNGQKTAAFYTPYNIIPGGGERYLFSVMQVIAKNGYDLTLIVPERYSRVRITSVLQNLGLHLPAVDIITYAEAEASTGYDLFYCLGNEICPTAPAMGQTNIYCCQFPFESNAKELERRLPWLSDYDAIVCYSEFVEGFIRKKLAGTGHADADVRVIYPPVGLAAGDGNPERESILSIGRFFAGGHCKRQDVMIEALRDLVDRGVETELHLVGSLHPEPEHRDYAADCRRRAEGLPVKFHIDAPPEELAELLRRSSVYWHGAGLGVDADVKPQDCEHFGISVVEAMSARLVPLVVSNGGPSSIVEDGVSGFHYANQHELVDLTESLLGRPESELTTLRDNAQRRTERYSDDAFQGRWEALLGDIAQRSRARSA